ncbi:hypothetical protein Rifp1Sym_au00010 [endosymbiont of Riftia pachyptila (vent Ph05)]|uniref:site-specific DNA-methyltransferase (adenine-specific) n=1 Tax=endosymbiont of Riftia pachyptila (vent Ph05) TaxID=1048808 RepID=G2DBQ8_9GAMM|nr:hypothetical protein Rifp1Sym_au00010 [endosymbiont of Riftia pachyptila (vent Ph05)]
MSTEQSQKTLDALIAYDQSVKSPTFGHRESVDNCKQALRQADYLSTKYHVVIANPPYMGGKGMNGRLGKWAKDNYPNSKSDLFAMFIERNLDLVQKQGSVAMITMQSWMFLSSFEKLRSRLLAQNTILSMAHLGARAFDSIGGEVVSTTAFVLENKNRPEYKGGYLRLIDGNSEAEKGAAIREAIKNPDCSWFYRASAADFKKIPGSPIAYWAPNGVLKAFEQYESLKEFAVPSQGMATTNNDLFLRQWHECPRERFINPKAVAPVTRENGKWFACNKGGPFRKWYGNNNYVVNYENDGEAICEYIDNTPNVRVKSNGRVINRDKYFKVGTTWSTISSARFSMRFTPPGYVFETKGAMCFPGSLSAAKFLTALGCSKVVDYLLTFISPTLDYHEGPLGRLPIAPVGQEKIDSLAEHAINNSIIDWDSYETSWDFTDLPLLHPDYREPTLKDTYQKLRTHWQDMILEMQRLEEENNRIFIEAYGLQDELTPEVPLTEITLTCNPHYRYGGNKSEEELETLLLADTMKEFISYAVGCMFGRYALEKPGLVLANQGETIDDYLKQIPDPSFPADDDNVIPMLDGNWFTDDITERFYKFLRVTFGEEHFEENLQFIEKALNIKGKRNYTIRDYFLKEFYSDHVKRHKKRPIYWLFSSSKGSFNALIYMHRYRPDTVSVILNDYLREFRTKLASEKNHLEAVSISASATAGEKTKALKEIEKINKMITELEEYEREVLYPLATKQVEIDLDDGVKVNYNKFGKALKKIAGLTAKG